MWCPLVLFTLQDKSWCGMRPVPRDPLALQERIMSALLGDIADTKAKGFPRLDALRSLRFNEEGK